MSVPFTPHTVLIDGVSIACYIEPEDAAALFQDTGIEREQEDDGDLQQAKPDIPRRATTRGVRGRAAKRSSGVPA